ncbi:MAG: formate--tetrahydrofolate ligase, partial [Eubacteriales bacterium]|nr:formate--tetrahydrofolate ligase [Eubacteriales bacterium]
LCLANDLMDLKRRLGDIVVAYDTDGKAVTAAMLHAQGAMAALLKDALLPNLVQTLEGAPAFVHGGPFANIAHGCNTVLATKTAMGCADWVVTEAGFGADLGAEKFLDIKCRKAGIWPEAVVLVATIRALKYHGGIAKEDLGQPNVEAVEKGMGNMLHHIRNLQSLGLPVVVAINAFTQDTDEEQQCVERACAGMGVPVERCTAWADGGKGAQNLAKAVMAAAQKKAPQYLYDENLPIPEKIEAVVKNWYGGAGVEYSKTALHGIDDLVKNGYDHLPVCIAKTQFSFSDKASLHGDPKDFVVKINRVKLQAGCGFIVAQAGAIMTMPGLPPVPAAEGVDVDADGNISGLF